MARRLFLTALFATAALSPVSLAGPRPRSAACPAPLNVTDCAGKKYVYEELAGVGILPGNGRDKYGDTLGGIGSAVAVEPKSWKKEGKSYTGILWALPDRGWNTEGTLNFQPRLHKFQVTFTPVHGASVKKPAQPNLVLKYLDTILFTDPSGRPATGLDPTGVLKFSGYPDLPAATYTGDGFGGAGSGGTRVSIDGEGLVLNSDGSFWVSDEYGPFVYLFDCDGKMQTAIKPPAALIPRRNGTESYSANAPPRYNPDAPPTGEAESGRANNRGFEGLAGSEDGNTLWVILQSATVQEGGASSKKRRYTRLLKYDVSDSKKPIYKAEHIVPLALFTDTNDKNSEKAASQSELHSLKNGQFLLLSRDSSAGHGADFTRSNYRQIDIFDISGATDIKGKYDDAKASFAPDGKLVSGVETAKLCPWIDFNMNAQLGRFGLHNGGEQDAGLLNEKWEGIAIVPAEPDKDHDKTYYILVFSDNDFITQDGAMNSGKLKYSDESGYELDNQALVFKVKLP